MPRYTDMFMELVRLEIELWDGLDAHLSTAAGVTLARYQALAAVRAHGAVARVQDISEEMSITVGATSKLVDRLERDGLAVRSAHPTDRRSSLISLSDSGAHTLETADVAAEDHLRRVLGATLPEGSMVALREQLAVLRAQVSK
jgi:DNA-binding MarR family transcriptional regulator